MSVATAICSPDVHVSEETELVLYPPRVVGVLNHVRTLLAERGIEVLATSPYTEGQSQQLLLVVHDGHRASAILHDAGIHCHTESVLLVQAPLRMDLIPILGSMLRSVGVGIQHTFFSSSDPQRMAGVFKTTDESRALEVLTGATHPAT
jgi:hypothetical protein